MASYPPRRPLLCAAVCVSALLCLALPLFAASIRGTVVDADEHPVSGASVWLYQARAAEGGDTAEWARVASTVTGADGVFSLPSGDAPARSLMLFAYRAGSAIACCGAPQPGRPL